MLGQDIAGFEIGCEKDVRIARNLGVNTFDSAASLLIALSKARGPSRIPPLICPRSAILQSAAASIVAGIFEVTVSTAARIATLGFSDPARSRDQSRSGKYHFVFQRGGDIDRTVSNNQDLVIRRDVHHKDVTDATAGPQSSFA